MISKNKNVVYKKMARVTVLSESLFKCSSFFTIESNELRKQYVSKIFSISNRKFVSKLINLRPLVVAGTNEIKLVSRKYAVADESLLTWRRLHLRFWETQWALADIAGKASKFAISYFFRRSGNDINRTLHAPNLANIKAAQLLWLPCTIHSIPAIFSMHCSNKTIIIQNIKLKIRIILFIKAIRIKKPLRTVCIYSALFKITLIVVKRYKNLRFLVWAEIWSWENQHSSMKWWNLNSHLQEKNVELDFASRFQRCRTPFAAIRTAQLNFPPSFFPSFPFSWHHLR